MTDRADSAHSKGPESSRRPAEWLDPLASALGDRLRDSKIRAAAAGRGWLSLAVDEGFLWLVARAGLRQIWIWDRAIDRARLEILGRRRSPLSEALAGRRIEGLRVLVSASGRPEGLRLLLDGPWPHLDWRGWPRPGALWVADAHDQPRAQEGRMEGESLVARAAEGGDFDLLAHGRICQQRLEAEIADTVQRRLVRSLRRSEATLVRHRAHLKDDLDTPETVEAWRRDADLLAAHLHELRRGDPELCCEDFEGNPRRLPLDPGLAPHENLDRAYRRVRRAEQRRHHVTERLAKLEEEEQTLRRQIATLEALASPREDLEAWLELARRCDVDLRPAPDPRHRDARPARRPYWTWLLDETWEIRVGRSARDNDALLRAHRTGGDLWFHAQGVTGSHVLLCRGDREAPAAVLEKVARLAAHFSKARHSKTVPVLCTQRRYVRKPRKAAPGAVVVERERTLFVEPGIAEGMRKVGDGLREK